MTKKRVGKYTVLERIGRGGMAEVLAGLDTSKPGAHRLVAIKQIRANHSGDAEFVDMFLDEARIQSIIQHPNLVKFYELGIEGDEYFMALEFLQGLDVKKLLDAVRRSGDVLSIGCALSIIVQAARGLHHAHEAKTLDGIPLEFVHRDVSPHNIFVTFHGVAKVLDFGVAKAKTRMNETQQGIVKGKVPYMSPEQCHAEQLDGRSDVFALGIVLFELLTGKHPFRGENEFLTIRAILEGPLPSVTALRPDADEELEGIVFGMLARSRTKRFATAKAAMEAILSYADARGIDVTERAISMALRGACPDALSSHRQRLSRWFDSIPGASFDQETTALMGHRKRDASDPSSSFEMLAYTPSSAARPRVPSAILPLGAHMEGRLQQRAGFSMVTLRGSCQESFNLEAWPALLQQHVLFDLSGLTKMTSFGVRQWLELMRILSDRDHRVFMARVSATLAHQMGMNRGLVGRSAVVSCMAPYYCSSCGHEHDIEVDCSESRDAALKQTRDMFECPVCHGESEFDADPLFFSFVSSAGVDLPAVMRDALDALDTDSDESNAPIQKRLSGRTTQYTIAKELPRGLKVKRYFEGLEGDVEVVFARESDLDDARAHELAAVFRGLAKEGVSFQLKQVPTSLYLGLEEHSPELVSACETISVKTTCSSSTCNSVRYMQLSPREFGGTPPVCHKCGADVMVVGGLFSKVPPVDSFDAEIQSRELVEEETSARLRVILIACLSGLLVGGVVAFLVL